MAMRRGTMVAVLGMMLGAGVMLRAQAPVQPPEQGDRPEHGAFAGMQHVEGEVTAVAGATVTVKTEDGATMQIVTTDNTRVMRNVYQRPPTSTHVPVPGAVSPPPAPGRTRGPVVKVSDLKVGDGVMAVGNLDAPNQTLHAAFVMATDAAQVKAMRENLGKTYIAGRVTTIDLDNAKMTVERPDHVTQTIGFDETTSFRRGGRGERGGFGGGGAAPEGGSQEGAGAAGGESITLADIKVGDVVRGSGSVKGGVFVAAQLVVGGRRRGGEGAAGAGPGAGAGPQ
jgi:hypothetical protein